MLATYDGLVMTSPAHILRASVLLGTCLLSAACTGTVARSDAGHDAMIGEGGLADLPFDAAQPDGVEDLLVPDVPPTPDQGRPDGPLLTFCTSKIDADTLTLLTFESITSGAFDDISGRGHTGVMHGSAQQGASGKPGCLKAAVFDGQADSYLEIANHPDYALAAGSVDLWVRFDQGGMAGIVSKDASGTNEDGHLTIFRGCDGSIVVRQQLGGDQHFIRCSSPVSNGDWHSVGVNFGSGGLELWVDGKQGTRTGALPCGETYVCGSSTETGIGNNSNPWVVGAHAMNSDDGAATPVRDPLAGAIDSLRISKVRRAFAY